MKHKIFLGVIALFLLIGGWEIFGAFLNEHQYYFNMFANGNNWMLVIMAIVSAMIPTGYILWKRKSKLPTFGWMTALAVAVFSLTHIAVKDSILGGGFLLLLFNLAILLGLALYFILGLTALGTTILRRWQHIKQADRRWMLFSFATGLAVLLILVHFLIIIKLLYPIITWIIFAGLGYFIWKEWKVSLAHHRLVIEEHVLGTLHISKIEKRWKRIGIILFIMTIMYLLYGLNLSFIPYPTAWDANHAYMYIPKVWAENHGALGIGNPGHNGGLLWYSYITFWFSLWQPLKSFVMAPDTLAVVMNYISGLFVIGFGLGLVKEVTGRIMDSIKKSTINKAIVEQISLYGGRMGMLLWLTSGMGAFLVFVDNKTDLGVLALTLVGLLAAFVWLRQRTIDKKVTGQFWFGLILSAVFLGLAVASKPTAIIDVAIITLLLIGMKLNTGFLVSVGLIIFAVMAKLQFLATGEFLDESQMTMFLILGAITLVFSVLYSLVKQTSLRSSIGRRLGYLVLWGAIIVGTIFVIKGPYAIPRYIEQGGSFINRLLLSEQTQRTDSPRLFASTNDPRTLLAQTAIDIMALESDQEESNVCSLDALGITREDLYENTRRWESTSAAGEDVGRYIGFGRKEFSHPSTWNAGETKGYGPIKLGYRLARLIGPKDGRCFAFDTSAQAICELEDEVNRANPTVIQSLYQSLDKDSKGYELIADLWEYEPYQAMVASGTINPGQVRDELVALRAFYQSHSIKNDNGTVYIPYRFLVPMNVVFNRSLQNLSSYYTDIGFVWLLFMVLMLVAAVYGIVRKDSKLTNLALATVFGRIIRWLMAGGIVWYGIGLIIRTILVMAAFTKKVLVDSKEDNSPYLLTIFALLALWFALQFVFNFVRISSQGGGGPFAWYKMHAGTNIEITDTLQQTQTLDIGYGQQDVFDMQFPHYNKFINYVKDRDPADGVSIHGTYLQYFLHEQRNVGRANIYYLTSDGDTCLSYLRFKDEGWKHIVIDPNILSVVMGEGNESLMHRFFARRNAVDGTIEEDGEMTMIVKMRYDDYFKFFNSNNLGAKYAFTLDDATLTSAFGEMNRDQLVYLRAKLAVARFFPDAQELIGFIGNMLAQRIITGQGLGDLADIFGRDIDPDRLLPIAQQLVGRNALTAELQAQIAELNQDERFVLTQYVNIYSMSRSNPQQYQQTISSLLQQSLAGGSQIIILERNDAL